MFAYAPKNAKAVKRAIEKDGEEAYILKVDEGRRAKTMVTA
jgi:hypothetical protein